jgi:Protein of unknown function/Domain of unknown function (DUF1835)
MTQTILHYVFTASGAGCLVQALGKAGRDDQVIASFDDMSFGPINPADSSLRAKWIEKELGQTEWDEVAAGPRLCDETLFPDNRKVAWLTRRSAMEYAGFLEWLWRLGDAPCEVVDLTETERPKHGAPQPPVLAISIAMLHHDTICNEKLWDLAEPLQISERRRYLELWRQLRSENAPLRVIDGGNLASAPISFFDSVLMSYATDNWQKVSSVVGSAMASQMDDCIIQSGDMFLTARINALVESGRLEIRGESTLEILFSEVRLPKVR